jgi:hypothetical protein
LGLAALGVKALSITAPSDVPGLQSVTLNGYVLLFTLAISLLLQSFPHLGRPAGFRGRSTRCVAGAERLEPSRQPDARIPCVYRMRSRNRAAHHDPASSRRQIGIERTPEAFVLTLLAEFVAWLVAVTLATEDRDDCSRGVRHGARNGSRRLCEQYTRNLQPSRVDRSPARF